MSCLSSFRRFHLDAADFEHSIVDNSSHGVGGWGDPENDFQIYTGGFKDVIRAYPNPHHIRRNFTLFPFQMPHGVFGEAESHCGGGYCADDDEDRESNVGNGKDPCCGHRGERGVVEEVCGDPRGMDRIGSCLQGHS